jgi:hypothetical protein
VERSVDRLGVGAAGVEPLVFGVRGRDGPEVLGAVELAASVFVGGVEPDAEGVAVGGELAEAEGAGFGIEDAIARGPVGAADGGGSDEDGAFDARLWLRRRRSGQRRRRGSSGRGVGRCARQP